MQTPAATPKSVPKGVLVQYWKEILSVVLFCAILGIEPAYRHPLYTHSLHFISDWQARDNSHATSNFFEIVSFFGSGNTLAGILVLIYCVAPRHFFFKMVFVYFVSHCMYGFFKTLYHGPQPYFSSDSIHASACTKGYGNPSGHTLTVTAIYGGIWYFVYVEGKRDLIPQKWLRSLVKWGTLVIIIGLIVAVSFARMYMAVHGINNVVFASCLGLWTLFFCCPTMSKYVDAHVSYIMKDNHEFTLTFGGVFILSFTVFYQVLNLVLYHVFNNMSEFMDDDWIPRIRRECPDMLDNGNLLAESFVGVIRTILYPLIYLSQLISFRYFPDSYKNWHVYVGIPRYLGRILLAGVVLCISEIPYFILGDSTNVTLVSTVGVLLPNILIALFAFPFIDWGSLKFGLVLPKPKEIATPSDKSTPQTPTPAAEPDKVKSTETDKCPPRNPEDGATASAYTSSASYKTRSEQNRLSVPNV